jgi:long-chain acyl-CoA synthetase
MYMEPSPRLTFPSVFAETVRSYGSSPAMAFVGETPMTYAVLGQKIKSVIALLEQLGIEPGDRVAILGTNMPNWGVSYYALTFMGAVAVPLLPDFHQNEIANILEHSGSKAVFISDGLLSKLPSSPGDPEVIRIRIEDFSVPGRKATWNSQAQPGREYDVNEDDLAAIIYTSGTTGKPKGVMLTHRNIVFTAERSGRVQEIREYDRFLSILPLSHTYENTIGLVLPMLRGACIYYLGKAPTPSILLPALLEVRPTIMLTVPLIIEKIFRSRIQPHFSGNFFLRIAIRIPYIRKKLNVVAGKKLMQTFGGELRFFGIGGAKLNKTVEKFLIEARFPYAIGYGLTETSPLLAGFNPTQARLQSTGPAIQDIELKISNPDPRSREGEIWARGPNVMKGYYKDPDLTSEIITPDGWLKTGDLGLFDRDGYLYIKGRIKNMIVGAGGENIYPEDIESIINNFRHVVESLVVEQKGKIVAMVHFNIQEIEEMYHQLKHGLDDYVDHKLEELRVELQHYVNARVNKASQVQVVIIHPDPFQKTPTQKIKRFLYT